MILSKLLPVVVGLGAGILVSAGVFTVLLSVGLVPRFAGKTHGGKNFSVRRNGCLWNARRLSGKRISGRSNFWQGMVAEKVGSGSSF